MVSCEERWWGSFNRNIYNHHDLRRGFRGNSDTETLTELLAMQGIEKTFPQLNGMLALAALNTREGKLYLARDPFGIKPLHYENRE